MNYFLKVYGYSKGTMAKSNFNEMGKEEGAAYYLLDTKIYFSKKPSNYSKGDIFIQYAPLGLKGKFKGRILGVYESMSTSILQDENIEEIDEETGKTKEWPYYVKVKNLNLSFSERSMVENLLNMREEKNNIDFPTGTIAIGFATLSEKDALYLIDRINSF